MAKVKSLNLMSGGLDSMLAVKVLQEQGIEVTGLCFKTPFFNEENAVKVAGELGINLIVEDVSDEHLEVVKNPIYGYGKHMNPCIDCHGFMFRKAKEIAKTKSFDIIATGEVLGQRPMSQNSNSLKIVDKLAGLEGKILRPLSAKVLPITDYEKDGIVDRIKLLGITGKGRKEQFEMVEKYNIKFYVTPAGGCKLTNREFSIKLEDLLNKHPEAGPDIMYFLQVGRHIWEDGVLFIVTRDKEDSDKLEKLRKPEYLFVTMRDFPGPVVLCLFAGNKDLKDPKHFNDLRVKAAKLILHYKKRYNSDIFFVSELAGQKEDFIIS